MLEMSVKKSASYIVFAVVAGHTALVLWVTYSVVAIGPEGPMLWLVPFFLDLPISILSSYATYLLSEGGWLAVDIELVVLPATFHVVLGGLQYYIVTKAILSWAQRRRIRPGHCLKCGYNLTGNVSGVCPECGERIRSAILPII